MNRGSGRDIVSALGGPEWRFIREETEYLRPACCWTDMTWPFRISEGSDAAPLIDVSIETGKQRPLTFPPAATLGNTSPAISPDGKTLGISAPTIPEQ